ncbi:hypothetical protein [Kitasatospora sp. Root107]|uniref:hypothetical protein n=1 Tax=Kitasatospora sp. Root107 TaxID=1736424 RepID=UPI000708C6FF|nr:hypothetical protein [Kitasatospora sp. Root107]KQV13657.1 hypothetical protein ASC99_33240 [Kitasatospora sp. Root107]
MTDPPPTRPHAYLPITAGAVAFPYNLPIRPAVRSDGNATTYELTRRLGAEQPAAWDAYCSAVRGAPCGATAIFPAAPGTLTALGSASTVAAFVANEGNKGSIGYTNASYAMEARLPTARALNGAGY